ncbi:MULTISPECIES: hydrogenase expression/formation protein HypE [unclassified Synechococcus]|uniref:hydrogenase expression/formation protein HypE n=1 Tax=unclassified Synechococcus TaxID=2626047 RepID=UPI000069902F|nr:MULTISPECIES: hydrogenase expression/formation protein HypE [unclassified Synechococcus]EAQ74249.1 hydrogenase expression/formation protein; HypE [Synechococcus sp. WH 5701]WFN60038.1 hydrogenase expression/formation protein HypE [Synechococcus sp. CCFWC 502]
MAAPLDFPCPISADDGAVVLLGHGGGGLLSQRLLEQVILPALGATDGVLLDAASLTTEAGELAFSTDGHVVRPLEFPGGDIGALAVFGTVNDLAMLGATPLALSLGLILEEGLPLSILSRVLSSAAAAAARCGVSVVTGDTKVVERGKADGLFMTTAGIGRIPAGVSIGPSAIRSGDAILVSGDLGRHGLAILAAREELGFSTSLESDLAPLHGSVQALLAAGLELHALRDLTRGGLAAALHELCRDAGLGGLVHEAVVPVHAAVATACELLGLDPLTMASEGRFVMMLPASQAQDALKLLRHEQSSAAVIGRIGGEALLLETSLGVRRPLELGRGELLPRIC